MRLLSIELENVGIHKHLAEDLSGNLIGVIGPNGSGKSTLLSSIYYAITGDSSRLGKKDGIEKRKSVAESEASSVRLFVSPVSNTGEIASIMRWLPSGSKPGRRRLVYNDRVLTSDEEVTTEIEKWCGLSVRALAEFVFIRQDDLTGVVNDQPAKRAAMLQKLFGLDVAESAREGVTEALVSLPAVADVSVAALILERKAEAERELSAIDAALSQLPIVDEERVRRDRDIVERRRRSQSAAEMIADLDNRISDLEEKLHTPLPPFPDETEIDYCRSLMEAWQEFSRIEKLRSEAQVRLDDLDRRIKPLAIDSPCKPTEPEDCAVGNVRLSLLRDLTESQSYPYNALCPVCQQDVFADSHVAERHRRELEELESQRAAYTADSEKYRTAELAFRSQQVLRVKLQSERDTIAQSLPTLPEKPEFPQRVVASELDRLLENRETYSRVIGARLNAEERLPEYVRQRDELRALVGVGDVSEEEIEEASRRLVIAEENERKKAELMGRKIGANRILEHDRKLLEEIEQSRCASASLTTWRTRLETVRGMLHRDDLPALAARGHLVKLSEDVNARLGHLSADFQVAVREDGSLWAEFGQSKRARVRSDLLSKGQAVTLSIAWMLAIGDRYAPSVGLLCLDEPTAGLDHTRIDALRSALEAWKTHAADRQFVIVTHDRRLMGVFDRVVELE